MNKYSMKHPHFYGFFIAITGFHPVPDKPPGKLPLWLRLGDSEQLEMARGWSSRGTFKGSPTAIGPIRSKDIKNTKDGEIYRGPP